MGEGSLLTRDRGYDVQAPAQAQAGCEGLRIAYLTNVYPKTSHTFVRNEIAALERAGVTVTRLTIRARAEPLVEPADVAEAAQTTVLLPADAWRPAIAFLRRLIRSPRRMAGAIGLIVGEREGWPGLVRAAAYLAEACRMLEITEANGIGHVHVHFGTNPATVARLAARLGDLRYSMTVHGPDEFDSPAALLLPAKIADARFVVAVSHYGRAQLMRWSRQSDWAKLHVVRCGVSPTMRTGVHETAGLRSRTLLCVARLSGQKGIFLLLDAAVALRERGKDFTLRIVGDGELRDAVEHGIRERALDDRVALLGACEVDVVRAEILAARALVLPSFAEGLPVVLMEALALGRPVIATAIAGIPELVDARTGWLVPAGSLDALVDAMQAALATAPDTLAEMAATGTARVRRDHDVDANAALLLRHLRRATAPVRSKPRGRNPLEDQGQCFAP